MKKCLAIYLSFVLLSIMLLSEVSPTAKAAGYGINSPVIDTEQGITTYDCIYFGNYWQNDTNGDGVADQQDEKEPIKWRVLSVEGNAAFLLADQNLDVQPYHNEREEGQRTWETCSLRAWLNGEFYDAAFSEEEKSSIQITTLSNQTDSRYQVDGGNDTQDKIYLVSGSDMLNTDYGFPTWVGKAQIRDVENTEYAKDRGLRIGTNETAWWWLRSPAEMNKAFQICSAGYVEKGGMAQWGEPIAVRPALRIHLSGTNWVKADTESASLVGEDEVFCTPEPTAVTENRELHNPWTSADGSTTWDYIYFGSYYANNCFVKEPIKWRVLQVDGKDAFIIAEKCLDAGLDYRSGWFIGLPQTWETSGIRAWLNGEFYEEAFSEEEKRAIRITTVVTEDNLEYGTDGGEDTEDRIYLPSMEEVTNSAYGFEDSIGKSETRQAQGTQWAAKQQVGTFNGDNTWWLRNRGSASSTGMYIDSDGVIFSVGFASSEADSNLVRPVLHLDLSSSVWSKVDTGESPEETPKAVATSSAPVSTATPKPSSAAVVSVSKELQKTAGVKAVCTAGNKIRLTWKRSSGVKQYAIYRSNKKNGKYRRIKTLTGTKKSYTDISAGKGKTYYYKIVPVDRDGTMGSLADATGVRAATHALAAPVIRVTRRQTKGGQKYVQIRLKKYEGTYAEIYVQDKGKYRRIRIRKKTISAYRKRYRLRFQKGGRTVKIKVRTYRIRKGKKQYSGCSKVKAIKL